MISTVGLHRHTRQKVIAANNEFYSITSTDIPTVHTLPDISQQAERYKGLLLAGESTNNEILPGCSLLNYGIGLKVVMVYEYVLLMTNPTFEEMMAGHDLVPLSNVENGDFFHFSSPHLSRIRSEIQALQQQNTGKAWLWLNTINDYIDSVRELEVKEEELATVRTLEQEMQQDWQSWRNRRDTLIAILNITLAQYLQWQELFINLQYINEQIESLEAEKTQLELEREAINTWIAAHDADVDRYNADVQAYQQMVDQWNEDYIAWLDSWRQLMDDCDDYEENPEKYSQEEIDALYARIDQNNAIFASLEARRIALDEEYLRLQSWGEQIEADEQAIFEAVADLEARMADNQAKLDQANSQKNDIENAIATLPPISDVNMAEFEWLIQEEIRLTQLEQELASQRASIETSIDQLNTQMEEELNREEQYLNQIKEFVRQVNFSIDFEDLRGFETATDRVLQELENAERVEKVREKLGEIFPELGTDDFDGIKLSSKLSYEAFEKIGNKIKPSEKWIYKDKYIFEKMAPLHEGYSERTTAIYLKRITRERIYRKETKRLNKASKNEIEARIRLAIEQKIKNHRLAFLKWRALRPSIGDGEKNKNR